MNYYEVAPTKIFRSGSSVLTYEHPEALHAGHLVMIEIGKVKTVGLITGQVTKPSYPTKPIIQVLETTPLPKQLVDLALWLSTYYSTPLATTLQTLLPRGLSKSRRNRDTKTHTPLRSRTKIVLNKDQTTALQHIEQSNPGPIILHGITGSGKTAVYTEAAQKTIAQGKSVIIIIPEIALTTQIVDEFSMHFTDIIVTHSRQTEAERHLSWRSALASETPKLVIGPRSALFTPLKSIGLIVIDEFHEPSLKQEQAPRYSAIRVASILGASHKAKIILGSATPPITDYYLAQSTDRPIIHLVHKARDTTPPHVTLVDMTKREFFKNHRFFSDSLLEAINNSIAKKQQSLIFHNRRGSTSMTLCQNCGWQATCPRCFVPLSLHTDQHKLRCHICNFSEKVPTKCPDCENIDIVHKGIGTKLIESELKRIYPKANIARFDGDNTTETSLDQRYVDLYNGNIDIIIGTQVVAKGLDLPHLTTVGVIQADSGLSLPDYTSTERTFQLLAQAAGRVGRDKKPSALIVQSYRPDHPSVTSGLSQDYETFYDFAIHERRRALFPPFTYLLKLTCVYKTERSAIQNAKKLSLVLQKTLPQEVSILGPTPAFYERQRDTYRWQLILKSPKRSLLQQALELVPQTHWQYELDPVSLL